MVIISVGLVSRHLQVEGGVAADALELGQAAHVQEYFAVGAVLAEREEDIQGVEERVWA